MRVKRILGLLLALALVFSLMMPAAAFANEDGGEVPQGEKTNELLPEDPGQGNDDGNDDPPLEDEGEPAPTRNIPPPAAPQATVTALNPEPATFNTSVDGVTITRMLDTEYRFSYAQQPSQEQMDAYGSWYCDFFVSVSGSVPADSVGFWGRYGVWGAFGFTNPYEVPGNSPLPLVRTSLADAPGIDVSTLTLNDIVYSVVTFDCGVANLSAANCGKTLTVDLRIWNPENENESYSLGETTYTFALAPTAKVTEVASPKTNIGFDGTTADLDAEYLFSFQNGEPTDPQLNLFGDWNCDYFVSFNDDIAAGTIGLYGQYDSYGGSQSFKNPALIAANTEIPLVRTVFAGQTGIDNLNLNDIATFVRTFDCGVVNLDASNAGTTMTVELRIWKGDSQITCASVDYTFAEAPKAVVTPVASPKTGINFSGTTADLEAEYVFSFEDGEPTRQQLNTFGDWNCDYFVSFNDDIAAGTVGFYGQYGTEKRSFANPDVVAANTPVPLVRTLLAGQDGIDNLNLSDIATFVQTFDCGVVGLDPSVAGTTMTVELRIWKGDSQIVCGSVDYTFAAPPEAVATPVDPLKSVTLGGKDYTLEAEYLFSFNENEPSKAQLAAYGSWLCDYFVSFDDEIPAGTIGFYGQYGNDERAFLNPDVVAANTPVPLVRTLLAGQDGIDNLNLRDIDTFVHTFDCGVVNLDPANAGKTITVELRIWKGDQQFACAEVEYTFPEVLPPEAVVTPVDPLKSVTLGGKDYTLEAEYLFSFNENEPSKAQLAAYGSWLCDYFVSFDDEIPAGTVGFYGQYGNDERSFLNPDVVAANTPVPLVRTLLAGQDGIENLNLRDIDTFVHTFDCGVVNLDPANAGTMMTVELRIWKGDTKISLAKVEYTFPTVEPPVAVVTEKPEPTSIPIDGTDTALQAEYVFSFKDSEPTTTQLNMFGSWYCDYIVKFSDGIPAESIAMYGQYDSYGSQSFKNPALIAANTEIPLVRTVREGQDGIENLNLRDINTFVHTFDCGVVNLDPANAGKKMTVELRIWNPDDDTQAYTLAKVEYTFLDPDAPPFPNAVITELTDLDTATIGTGEDAEQYPLEAEYVFNFDDSDPDLLADQIDYYGGWYCDYIVSFDKPVAANTVGVYGQYELAGDPLAFLNPEVIAAGDEIPLVRAIAVATGNGAMGETLNLSDIATFVHTFTCGVFNLSEDNVGTTMTVELRIWNKDDPTQKHNCGTVDYTFKGKCTVSASGQDSATGALVGAQITGGGDYFTGTEVTLTANPVQGYSFGGWYKDGAQVCTSMVYTFTVTEDVDLIAYYIAGGTANLHVHGEEFLLDGVSYSGDPQNFQFPLGTEITIESTQEHFAYWTNVSNNIVSTGKTYTFVIVSDTTLREQFSEAPESGAAAQGKLYFLNAFKQVIQAVAASINSDFDQILDVDPPSKMGNTFDKWIIEESGDEATADSIKALFSATEAVVLHIKPTYTPVDGTFTVNVKLLENGELNPLDPLQLSANIGEPIVVTKQAVANYFGASLDQITAWKIGDTIVSYADQHTVMSGNSGAEIELIAVCDPDLTPVPVISITQQYAAAEGNGYKLATTMKFNVPDGYTLRESGFIFSVDSAYATEDLVVDAPNTTKHLSSNTGSSVTYTMNLTTSAPSRVLHIRAFLTYTDGEGNIVTIYSAPLHNCVNDVLSNH